MIARGQDKNGTDPGAETLSPTNWKRLYRMQPKPGAQGVLRRSAYSSWREYTRAEVEPTAAPDPAEARAKRSAAAKKAAETRRLRKQQAAALQPAIDALGQLSGEDLVQVAVTCLHSLNRHAKHLPGALVSYIDGSVGKVSERCERDRIYDSKDRFLTALIERGAGALYYFDRDQQAGWQCESCEREWGGRGAVCHSCDCDGEPTYETRRWYLFEIHGHRFHLPPRHEREGWADRYAAQPIPAHDPTQAPREIPKVLVGGVDIPRELQLTVVARAISAITGGPPE